MKFERGAVRRFPRASVPRGACAPTGECARGVTATRLFGDNRRMRGFFSIAFVVIALFAASDGAAAPAVRAVDVEGGTYRVVDIDLSRDALELQWMDQEGRPLASINRLREWGAANGRTLLFATNAGIYDREYRPLGLTIAEGRVLRPLNTTRGRSGN